jgi:predicted permease
MPSFLNDLRYTLRGWRRQPSFVAVAVATLALGVGVNVVVFSLVESLVLRPLPAVDRADRVLVSQRNPFSYQAYLAFTGRQHVFEAVAAWQQVTASLFADGGAAPVEALFVSLPYFGVLRIPAERGRLLGAADEAASDRIAAVISERCWRTRFGGSPDAIGRTVTVNLTPVVIVGVSAAGFGGTELGNHVDIFLPITTVDVVRGVTGRSAWLAVPGLARFRAVGRLRPGVTADTAQAEANMVVASVSREIPSYRETTLNLVPVSDAAFPGFARDDARRVLVTLLAVAACVLLVACVNITHLLMARGEQRRGELGLRLALGASPFRIVSHVLTETLLLAGTGTVTAVVLARGALVLLSRVPFTAHVPIALAGALDLRVGGAAALLALIATLACGLFPAWSATRASVVSQLGRHADAPVHRRGAFVRDALVSAQVAASVVLVIAAILFVRSLRNQESLPPGFEPEGVAMMRLNVRLAGYSRDSGIDFYRRLQERVASLPGVVSVSRALNEPLGATAFVRVVGLPGETQERRVLNTVVAAGYFGVLGIPILEGRDFGPDSPAGSVIVNRTMARRLWPGRSAVGEIVDARDPGSPFSRVIGVVADSKYESLQEPATAFVYAHAADDYDPVQVVFVRTAGEASGLLPLLRGAVRGLDARIPVVALTTARGHMAEATAQPRAAASLVTALAVLAALLAAVGLGGTLSLRVSECRREVAIRLALGAGSIHVVMLVAGRVCLAVLAGFVAGAVGALLLWRFVASLLYGVRPVDPWVLALAGTLTLAVAALAAVGPAARAVATAPASALRE